MDTEAKQQEQFSLTSLSFLLLFFCSFVLKTFKGKICRVCIRNVSIVPSISMITHWCLLNYFHSKSMMLFMKYALLDTERIFFCYWFLETELTLLIFSTQKKMNNKKNLYRCWNPQQSLSKLILRKLKYLKDIVSQNYCFVLLFCIVISSKCKTFAVIQVLCSTMEKCMTQRDLSFCLRVKQC